VHKIVSSMSAHLTFVQALLRIFCSVVIARLLPPLHMLERQWEPYQLQEEVASTLSSTMHDQFSRLPLAGAHCCMRVKFNESSNRDGRIVARDVMSPLPMVAHHASPCALLTYCRKSGHLAKVHSCALDCTQKGF
jgi:hypothetical protein